MSIIPKDGYDYAQCSFKQEEKLKLNKIFSHVLERLEVFGLKNFFQTGDYSSLSKVPLKYLFEISSSWEKTTVEMELISYKIAVVKEFRMIKKLIEESEPIVNSITEEIQKLEENLKQNYSSIVSTNEFFNEYFSYKDFKNMFMMMTSADIITLDEIKVLKQENIFNFIRRKIISDKANIHSLLFDNTSAIIHINNIKNEDEKTYELLRTEFFTTYMDEQMKIKLPFGKKTHTETIRPAHHLGKSLKVEKTELVYLTISINPISELAIDLGQVIEFNNGMKFEVTKTQQVIERELFYQIPLDKKLNCNLIVPVYFSFLRCNLVKEQRSSSTKIDEGLIEQIALPNSK